ncbi:Uncharacterised protein [Salmonella enterica subsp. enterica]|uniref:Uncharacterized protein n=1 Tax=Salmonella enterica I TaxID=59201 RepID=A0A3S4LQ22_SALET|nr:Uncharacterised protein [Salmonella enterica subsp. enterica]
MRHGLINKLYVGMRMLPLKGMDDLRQKSTGDQRRANNPHQGFFDLFQVAGIIFGPLKLFNNPHGGG